MTLLTVFNLRQDIYTTSGIIYQGVWMVNRGTSVLDISPGAASEENSRSSWSRRTSHQIPTRLLQLTALFEEIILFIKIKQMGKWVGISATQG